MYIPKLIVLIVLVAVSLNAEPVCFSESEVPATTPSNKFTDHGNSTVTDNSTGLMWAKCAIGQDSNTCAGFGDGLSWEGALALADTSVLAGYSDWRLPNVKELLSIVEAQCSNPGINLDIFPNVKVGWYYRTASPSVSDPTGSWAVDFGYSGGSFTVIRNDANFSLIVRLVRSGP